MLEAICYDHLDCYLLLHLAWEKQAWGAASSREPGKSRAERAVLAEMCDATRAAAYQALKGACPRQCPFLGLIAEHI